MIAQTPIVPSFLIIVPQSRFAGMPRSTVRRNGHRAEAALCEVLKVGIRQRHVRLWQAPQAGGHAHRKVRDRFVVDLAMAVLLDRFATGLVLSLLEVAGLHFFE
jgi:hypothetical protein